MTKRVFGLAKHWKVSDEAFAPMGEEDLRWAEGFYQDKDGNYGSPLALKRRFSRLNKLYPLN